MSKQPNSQQARSVAIRAISRSLQGENLQACLSQELNKSDLCLLDINLATMLSYNYLRYKGRLDYIVGVYILHKPSKIPENFFLYLGLCIYEMMYLEKIPFYASVNWYVGCVKQRLSNRWAKTANAILRQISDNIERIKSSDFYQQDNPGMVKFWSRYFSCPQWIVDLWINNYGENVCKTLLASSLQAPQIGIRVNKTLPEADQLWQTFYNLPELKEICAYTFSFAKSPDMQIEDLESSGLISRQSPQIEKMLSILDTTTWELPLWDCCAGNGNKTTLFLEKGFTPLWASDLSREKIQRCQKEINRLHLKKIPLFVSNAAHSPPLKKKPRTVLIDAPCSGLGVISRRPDLKWKRTFGELKKISSLQEAILDVQVNNAQDRIVYFTCTLNPEENEQVVQKVKDKYKKKLTLEQEYKPELDLENNLSKEYFYAAVLVKK